jgi:hypothetical protein
VPLQSVGIRGQATDYAVASRENRAKYANLVPAGVAASAIRIGNDGCFYYVNGPVMAPLVSPLGGTLQICQ